MEQINMQLDLSPSVWEEGEEAAAEGCDGEKVQEAPAGGEGGVEASGSTSGAAGPQGEQQQGKAKTPTLPQRRKPNGVVMKGWETPVSRPGRTRMATMKQSAGADVAEQQLGNEEALLILLHGYDPRKEDEPVDCFLAPAPEEPASMEEAFAGPDSEKWLVSRDAEYQSLLENGTWDLVVLPEGKKAVQCKWVLRIKTNDKGQVTIYKNRLVAKGFMQKEKQDFNEIFAPTAKPPTLRLGEMYGIENERKVATPLSAEFKLVKAAKDEGVEGEEQQQFQSLVGSLLYAAVHTRPDISFRGGPVSWRSKKQTETAFSSVESEYIATFNGMKEVIWLRRLLEEIDQEQKVDTPLFCDSKGALGMATNAVLHGLNKHMCIKWHWLRKEVKRETVNPIFIKTHQQPADFLTKRLADEPHWHCMA
ncbi:unnamed protein product [Closterium sp. NIES-53]